MVEALEAGGWGLLAGSALLLGAALGYALRIPHRVVASVMAFGAGVLLSAVSFELALDAYDRSGMLPLVLGTVAGAAAYTAGNVLLARRGARHRKRSGYVPGRDQPSEEGQPGSGAALALGALLDGVPESAVIGLGLAESGSVGAVTVAAVFISNVPEGLSSSAGMRRAGRGGGYVFGLWGSIAAASMLAAAIGNVVAGALPVAAVAAVTAVAAGAILAMIADTMIPEAVEEAHQAVGLIVVAGFLLSFALSRA